MAVELAAIGWAGCPACGRPYRRRDGWGHADGCGREPAVAARTRWPQQEVTFTVPGPPATWKRPGGQFVDKDGKTRRAPAKGQSAAFDKIATCAKAAAAGRRFPDGPVDVTVEFWQADQPRPFPTEKADGDCDNRVKAVLDGVTRSGLWTDDAQVVDLRIRQRFVPPGGEPCTVVALRRPVEALEDAPTAPVY